MKKELTEWRPFDEYDTPCFVMYHGKKAIYAPELNIEPLILHDQEENND